MSFNNVFFSRVTRTIELSEEILTKMSAAEMKTESSRQATILTKLKANDFQSLDTKLLGTIKTEIDCVLPYDVDKYKMQRNAIKVILKQAKEQKEIDKIEEEKEKLARAESKLVKSGKK